MTFPFPRPLTMAKNPTSAWSDTLTSNSSGQTSRSYRAVTNTLVAGGYWVRARLQASSAGTFAPINVAIGIWSGSGLVTTATPIELLFSGASGVTITAGNTSTSDWARLVTTTSDRLVLIWDTGASNGEVRQLATGGNLNSNSFVYTGGGAVPGYNVATPGGTPNDLGAAVTLGFELVEVQ